MIIEKKTKDTIIILSAVTAILLIGSMFINPDYSRRKNINEEKIPFPAASPAIREIEFNDQSIDKDIKEIDQMIDSVSLDNFSETAFSEQNLGL